MKIFRNIFKWFRLRYKEITAKRYRSIAVSEYPKHVNKNTIYIVSEGHFPDTIIFKCPCGCHADIYLNLLKDTRPNWDFDLNNKGRISIFPSIWRKVGCRSHFLIREGKIVWV